MLRPAWHPAPRRPLPRSCPPQNRYPFFMGQHDVIPGTEQIVAAGLDHPRLVIAIVVASNTDDQFHRPVATAPCSGRDRIRTNAGHFPHSVPCTTQPIAGQRSSRRPVLPARSARCYPRCGRSSARARRRRAGGRAHRRSGWQVS